MSEKIKRFDDIFKMLLLILTITISVGSTAFENINLLSVLGFIVAPLVLWIIGHAFGSNPEYIDSETQFKLLAWGFESLAIPIVAFKFILGGLTLSYELVALCSLISFGLTVLPYVWLKEFLSDMQRRTFLRNLLALFMVIDIAVNFGIWVI
jgi:hypothetical protein